MSGIICFLLETFADGTFPRTALIALKKIHSAVKKSTSSLKFYHLCDPLDSDKINDIPGLFLCRFIYHSSFLSYQHPTVEKNEEYYYIAKKIFKETNTS